MFSPITGLGLAALTGIVAFGLITGDGKVARQGRPFVETLDQIALSLGFGISQVEITGHSFTTDASINDTLDLANARSLLRFDSIAARQRIERLAWIDTETVTRVFPDRLQIVVTERKPYARWQRGERTFLIDPTGRVLTPVQTGAVQHLPLVTGEGAAEKAAALLSLLEGYPAVAARLEAADRVDGRRWTLRLEGGPEVLLPADGEAAALDRLTTAGVFQAIAAMSGNAVDLRLPGRMIVRRDDARPPPPPSAAPASPSRSAEPAEGSATPTDNKDWQGARRG